jgi:hypothetical protein
MFTYRSKYIYDRPGQPPITLVIPTRREDCIVSASTDRTNYLSLALDARKTIKALGQLLHTGAASTELKDALDDTVQSLRALTSGGSLFSGLHAGSSYESYEQIRTLQEVQVTMKDEDLADRLSKVGASPNDAERNRNIELAIMFFAALENRALQRYNRSAGSAFGR